jgi:two-component system, OmpR family, phosphate regulon sensor histidine kinase PhoR
MLRRALEHALQGVDTDAAEVRIGERTLLLTARPLTTGGALLALRDLTALRRMEAVRRDFVANVSHELKTPLTVISGFAETLAEDEPPIAQRRQFIEAIRANAFRMQRLVDDLLDLSRIESGGWRPALAPVDLAAIVREALEGVAAAAADRGIALRSELAPDATTLDADPLAVRQVLANLVQNAVRYTERGSVTVATRRVDEGIEIAVRDTGIGIPPEHLPRIFERFYRVDAGRSRTVGGTGLGLAIVRHLVEGHGGSVTADSTPGEGTIITVRFPVAA